MNCEVQETKGVVAPSVESAVLQTRGDLSYADYSRYLKRLTLLLILLGMFVRFERYILAFPVWGDEASLTNNIAQRDFRGLTKKLDGFQVAPILFLWSELVALRALGGSEWAIRLLPMLAGCASLFLMAYIARQTVSRLAGMLAVGMLAAASYPIILSCNAKPYSNDLFFSMSLIAVALSWHRQPERVGRMASLALLFPIAVLSSFPAVFVAGGVSIALLPLVWRQTLATRCWFVLGNLLLIAAFIGHFELIGKEQLDRDANTVNVMMKAYWAHGFPPESVVDWPLWLLDIHSGRMMAYPVGEAHGGSALTLLGFLAGCVVCWKTGRRWLLVLLLAPFALNLIAAGLHKYPYGACCRISQHLAPAVCLLAGVGFASLIERYSTSLELRCFYARCGVGIFSLIVIGMTLFHAYRPFRDEEAMWTRKIVEEMAVAVKPADQVVVLDDSDRAGSVPTWYLERQSFAVRWEGKIDWSKLPPDACLWIVDYRCGVHDSDRAELVKSLLVQGDGRTIQGHVSYFIPSPDSQEIKARRCDVFWCTRPGHEVPPPRFRQSP